MSPSTSAGTSGDLAAATDATFAEEVLRGDLPVLVEFWAQWCPPCHQLKPVLAEIAAERAGSLAVRLVNSDENPATARDYGVMAVPTLMLFVGGERVWTVTGSRAKAKLLSELDDALRQLAGRTS